MIAGKTYQFREITTESELEKFIRLRYAMYSKCGMCNFLKLNNAGIDLDIYDLHARHFGLFCQGEPAGFIRVVMDKQVYFNEQVFNIGSKLKVFQADKHKRESLPLLDYPGFPFMSYLSVPESAQTYYEEVRLSKNGLVEASRLMLFGTNKGIRVAKFLVECAIILFVLNLSGQKQAVLNCDSRHEKFYQKYGFQTINGSGRYYMKGRGVQPSSLLSICLSLSSIPERYHELFRSRASEFDASQQILHFI